MNANLNAENEHVAAHEAIAGAHAVFGLRTRIEELRTILSGASDALAGSDDWRRAKALDCLAKCEESLQRALPAIDAAHRSLTDSLLWMSEPSFRTAALGDLGEPPDPADSWKG